MRGEPTVVHLIAYLAGLPYHGSPLSLLNCPQPTWGHAHPKSININVGWLTSLIGGERPGGNKFVCRGGGNKLVYVLQEVYKDITHCSKPPAMFIECRGMLQNCCNMRLTMTNMVDLN